jgi:hypothetical protein
MALIWIARQIDLALLLRALSRVDWAWTPLLVAVYLSSFLLRGLRWQIMLRPMKPIAWSSSTAILVVGFAANNVLPARLGELVRAYALRQREGISATGALASAAVERIFDGLTLLAIFAITAALAVFDPTHERIAERVRAAAAVVFLGGLAVVLVGRLWPARLEALLRLATAPLPARVAETVQNLARSALGAVSFLRVDTGLLLSVLLSVVIWLVEGAVFWLGLRAFSLPADPLTAYFTLAFVNFGLILPSAPGYVGVFEGCTILAFAAFGYPQEIALSYSIVIHFLQLAPISLLGLLLVNVFGVSLTAADPSDPPSRP